MAFNPESRTVELGGGWEGRRGTSTRQTRLTRRGLDTNSQTGRPCARRNGARRERERNAWVRHGPRHVHGDRCFARGESRRIMKFGHAGASGEPATVSWTRTRRPGHPGPRGARRCALELTPGQRRFLEIRRRAMAAACDCPVEGDHYHQDRRDLLGFHEQATFHMRGAFN